MPVVTDPAADDGRSAGVDLTTPGARIVVAAARPGLRAARRPRWPCWPRPTSPAGAAPTARPGPGPGPSTGSSTTWPRATTSCTASTGWPATAAWSPAPSAAPTRDYLLLEYRGDDKLYLPSDQIDAAHPLHRRRVARRSAGWAARSGRRPRSRARAAVHEIAQELVELYRRRLQVAGPRLRARHAVAARAGGRPSPSSRPPTSCGPSRRSRRTWSGRRAHGPPGLRRRRASARPRWPCGPCSRRSRTASRRRCSCPPPCWPSSTPRPSPSATPAIPVRVEMLLSRFLTTAQATRGGGRPGRRVRSTWWSAPTGCWPATSRSRTSGLLVVDEEQRFGVSHKEAIKAMADGCRRADPDGQPHPPDPGDGAHRHPRPVPAQHPAGGAPADPHLRGRVRGGGRGRGHPARAAARGPGVLRAQPGAGHREAWRPRSAALVPEARVAVAHGQMDEGTLEQVVLDFWEGAYDVLVCTTIIESGIDMPTVNTLVVDRADLLGPGPAPPAAGPGGAGRASGPTPTCSTRRPGPLRGRPTSGCGPSASTPSSGSGFKIAMRDLEIRGAGNLLGAGPVGPHRRGRATTSTCQMVAEAVAELKGEPLRPAGRGQARLPADAHLPADYVDARGPAPRGLPAPGRGRAPRARWTTSAPSGWTASGRCPAPAEALLDGGPAAGRVPAHRGAPRWP